MKREVGVSHQHSKHSHGNQGQPHVKVIKPIETLANFKNKNKYYEYHEDFRHKTSFENTKGPSISWLIRGK